MKLFVFAALASLSAAHTSPAVRIASKKKSAEYENVLIQARNRSIFIFCAGVDHSMNEIGRLNTALPIRSLHMMKSATRRYLFAYCNLGSIARVCVWNIDDPENPYLLALKVQT